jgi:hypothetical protein
MNREGPRKHTVRTQIDRDGERPRRTPGLSSVGWTAHEPHIFVCGQAVRHGWHHLLCV